MSRRRKKKMQAASDYVDAELNVMPFIDVFSVLNVFLLMSAAFVTLGVIKVQVPFFSNAEDDSKPKRTLQVKVDLEKDKATLITSYSMPPVDENQQNFTVDEPGIKALHDALVAVKVANPDSDLVTLYSEDDVVYEMLVKVLDAIKFRQNGDPEFVIKQDALDPEEVVTKDQLYPKVVMGSVIL